MRTSYFSFGSAHRHEVGDQVFDQYTLAEITSDDPRATAFEVFGAAWCLDYRREEAEVMAAKYGLRIVPLVLRGPDSLTPDELRLVSETCGGMLELLGDTLSVQARERLHGLQVKAASLAFVAVSS